VARILMPKSMVRLSAGRETMNDELQALCFVAGANSIFHGEKLLTTGNPDTERDLALFARLGLRPMAVDVDAAGHDRQANQSGGTVHAAITALPAHAA
jgi:biotin synthase